MKFGVYNAILHDRYLPEAIDVIARLGLSGIELDRRAYVVRKRVEREVGGRINPVCHSGYEAGYLEGIRISTRSGPEAQGPAGVAYVAGTATRGAGSP